MNPTTNTDIRDSQIKGHIVITVILCVALLLQTFALLLLNVNRERILLNKAGIELLIRELQEEHMLRDRAANMMPESPAPSVPNWPTDPEALSKPPEPEPDPYPNSDPDVSSEEPTEHSAPKVLKRVPVREITQTLEELRPELIKLRHSVPPQTPEQLKLIAQYRHKIPGSAALIWVSDDGLIKYKIPTDPPGIFRGIVPKGWIDPNGPPR